VYIGHDGAIQIKPCGSSFPQPSDRSGKAKKWAFVASMRKRLIHLNAMLRRCIQRGTAVTAIFRSQKR